MNYFDQAGHDILKNKYLKPISKMQKLQILSSLLKFQKGNIFLKNHLFLELKMHISWKLVMLKAWKRPVWNSLIKDFHMRLL